MSREYYDILPFRFLDAHGRALVDKSLVEQAVAPKQVLIRAGDAEDRRVFLLLEGHVEAWDPVHERVLSIIDPGHYFGERACLFDLPRVLDIRAVDVARVAWLPGEVFLQLLRTQPAFAHALGNMLRDKQGLFEPFERFLAELRHGATRGHIVIPKLLHLYRPLAPALHRKCATDALDLDALSYALARLPANIRSTLTLLLTDDVPWLYTASEGLFRPIGTEARRRSVYEMLPGKSLVVLRDGWSDLVDLVTCLCIYSVEARKLRHRVGDPARLRALHEGSTAAIEAMFNDAERAALARIFPDLPRGLYELATHHEDFGVAVVKSFDNYNSAHSERWTHQLAEATRALTGLDPRELPDDFEIHVVSSNTHSVDNCLSGWLWENAEVIEAWGQQHLPELCALPWHDPSDRLMVLTRHYLAAHPEARAARTARDSRGAVRLDETALTGIAVQLFDLPALAEHRLDPALPAPPQVPGLIANIDYAFGQQAEAILASIIALFGPRIRSVNILGKAGGLEGLRGDVMVATSFVEQEDDALHVPPTAVDVRRLAARVPDRRVHVGPILTVIGTVLQNTVMLNYYRRIWRCVGLEMEGSYYCRQLLQSRQLGALRSDVALRFLYYTSDLPLNAEHTLAGAMRPTEGVPPLYATTREVLTAIFEAPRGV